MQAIVVGSSWSEAISASSVRLHEGKTTLNRSRSSYIQRTQIRSPSIPVLE